MYNLDCYAEEFYAQNRLEGELMSQWFVPLLWETFQAKSMVDVGCGCGHYVAAYQRYAKKHAADNENIDVYGIEGSLWAVDNPIQSNVDIYYHDLRKEYRYLSKSDLVLCLEVAEHIEDAYADTFLATLCGLSDTIVITMAVPGAGGEHHVNEQWPNYWQDKFKNNNYQIDATDTFKMRRGITNAAVGKQSVTKWMMENMFAYKKIVNET